MRWKRAVCVIGLVLTGLAVRSRLSQPKSQIPSGASTERRTANKVSAFLARVPSDADTLALTAKEESASANSPEGDVVEALSPEQLAQALPTLNALRTTEELAHSERDEELLEQITRERKRVLDAVMGLNSGG